MKFGKHNKNEIQDLSTFSLFYFAGIGVMLILPLPVESKISRNDHRNQGTINLKRALLFAWIFFFTPWIFFATVNEPLRCEFFSGYRNDRLHWHLQDPGDGGELTYSELYRDLQFWENGLVLKTIHRDLVFYIKGSYAAFGPGTLFQRYANQNFTPSEPLFEFSSHGFAADTSGYFGYAVNLTADRTYKVILIPLIGMSGHFEQLIRNQGSPDLLFSTDAVGASSFTMHSSLPNKLHQTWYGFFIGGGFQIEPGGRFILQAGYTYHWLHCKFKTHTKNEVSLFDAGSNLLSSQETKTKIHLSDAGNLGHTGWAQIDYLFSKLWRMGFGAQIHYFSSRVANAHLNREVETIFPDLNIIKSDVSEKFKLRWTSISGFFETSRAF